MSMAKKEERGKRWFWAIQKYVVFFLLMAFLITCCMLLFLNSLQQNLQIEFTEENIRQAAVLTFGNVVLLSLVCTVIDSIRRKFMVERPVKRIVNAAKKLRTGNFPFASNRSEAWAMWTVSTALSGALIKWRRNCQGLRHSGQIS